MVSCVFSLECPFFTHKLVMALSSESINVQQTSQYSRAGSTIPNNKAMKGTICPPQSNKAENLAQEDPNYSGEPAIQNIHLSIYSHEQTSYIRKLSSWVLTIPDVAIRKEKNS